MLQQPQETNTTPSNLFIILASAAFLELKALGPGPPHVLQGREQEQEEMSDRGRVKSKPREHTDVAEGPH